MPYKIFVKAARVAKSARGSPKQQYLFGVDILVERDGAPWQWTDGCGIVSPMPSEAEVTLAIQSYKGLLLGGAIAPKDAGGGTLVFDCPDKTTLNAQLQAILAALFTLGQLKAALKK